MKSYLMPLFICLLIFFSCNDSTYDDTFVEVEIQKRSSLECVNDQTCDFNYEFPIKDSPLYFNITVTFSATMTEGDIYCLRQAYFKCFPLKMAIIQPSDPFKEVWCMPVGRPGISISDTIDSDPRVDDGG